MHDLGCSSGGASYGFPGAEVVVGGLDRAPLAKWREDCLHQVDGDTTAAPF